MHPRTSTLPLAIGVLLASCGSPGPAEETARVAQYSIEDFYENIGYRTASFSPDGRQLLVTSNETGVFNLWAIPLDGGTPRQVTASATDAMFSNGYFPADERILYSRDRGGDELTHIYVRNPDGEVIDLTPGEKLKAGFHGWSGDDRSLFVSTNERDPGAFDLYQLTAGTYERRSFYRNDAGYELGPISRDKRYIALVKSRTTNDTDLFLHDRRENRTIHITPHAGDVYNFPVDFAPDNTKLLFVSNSGREFASLRSHDTATGAQAIVYEEAWDVLGGEYSKGGRYLVVFVNEDSRFTARLLDATTMRRVALAEMPDGLLRGMRLSADDEMVAFYASDGSAPDDLYAGRIAGPKRRVTDALNPQIRRGDLVVPTVVRFTSYDGLEIPGLLYTPHQASPGSRTPALVLVHGGPGGQAVVGYSALVQALVNHGYVVFDINNRGSSGYGKTFYAMDDRKHGDADLGDVVASRQMLIDTGYVDPARIGIIGGSYGGYMVLAALTLQPDAFKVGVDLFGGSNRIRTIANMPPWWGAIREALLAEVGDPDTDRDRLRRISPLFNAARIKAPLMVLQGANDPRVLQVESDEIVAAARKNGVPVEYIVFPDEGHGFRKKENEITGYGAVLSFLDRYLKNEGAARTQ